jgi:hypothetical protein
MKKQFDQMTQMQAADEGPDRRLESELNTDAKTGDSVSAEEDAMHCAQRRQATAPALRLPMARP